jgi:hypothetical protein
VEIGAIFAKLIKGISIARKINKKSVMDGLSFTDFVSRQKKSFAMDVSPMILLNRIELAKIVLFAPVSQERDCKTVAIVNNISARL